MASVVSVQSLQCCTILPLKKSVLHFAGRLSTVTKVKYIIANRHLLNLDRGLPILSYLDGIMYFGNIAYG